MAYLINENALNVERNLSELNDAITACTDEIELADLCERRDFVRSVLLKMIDGAVKVSRKRNRN